MTNRTSYFYDPDVGNFHYGEFVFSSERAETITVLTGIANMLTHLLYLHPHLQDFTRLVVPGIILRCFARLHIHGRVVHRCTNVSYHHKIKTCLATHRSAAGWLSALIRFLFMSSIRAQQPVSANLLLNSAIWIFTVWFTLSTSSRRELIHYMILSRFRTYKQFLRSLLQYFGLYKFYTKLKSIISHVKIPYSHGLHIVLGMQLEVTVFRFIQVRVLLNTSRTHSHPETVQSLQSA